MDSATGLSIAANAFSVVGLADVVVRSTVQLSTLVSKVRAAPETRSRLLSVSQSLITVVSEARAFADRYKTSDYVVEDRQSLPAELHVTLSQCRTEIQRLMRYLNENASKGSGNFLERWSKSLGFALNEQDVQRSCQILEAYKTALIAILVVNGSNNSMAIRSQVKRTRTELSEVRKSVGGRIENMHQEIQIMSNECRQDARQTWALIETTHEQSQTAASGTQALITKASADILQTINGLKSQFQAELETAFENHISSLSFADTGHRDMLFEGVDPQSVIIPLTSMKSSLSGLLKQLARDGESCISQSDIKWMWEEYRNLLVFAHEMAVLALREEEAPCQRKDLRKPAVRQSHHKTNRSSLSSDSLTLSEERKILSSPRTASVRYKYSLNIPGGLVVVECTVNYLNIDSNDNNDKFIEFRFAHLPSYASGIKLTGVFGLFSRSSASAHSSMGRFIQEVNIVPSNSAAFRAVECDDIVTLRGLLASKLASPFDYSENGRSLLCRAALYSSPQSMVLLLQEGADPHNCHLGTSSFRELSSALWNHLDVRHINGPTAAFTSAVNMSTLAIKYGYSFDSVQEPLRGQSSCVDAFRLLLSYRGPENEYVLDIFGSVLMNLTFPVGYFEDRFRLYDSTLLASLDYSGISKARFDDLQERLSQNEPAYLKQMENLTLWAICQRNSMAAGFMLSVMPLEFELDYDLAQVLLADRVYTQHRWFLSGIYHHRLKKDPPKKQPFKAIEYAWVEKHTGTYISIQNWLDQDSSVESRVAFAIHSDTLQPLSNLLLSADCEIAPTEELSLRVARRSFIGHWITLYDHFGDALSITEKVILLSLKQHTDHMLLLLVLAGKRVPITNDIFKEAVKATTSETELVEAILEERGDRLPMTSDLVEFVLLSGKDDVIELVLDLPETRKLLTTDLLAKIAEGGNLEVLETVLEHIHGDVLSEILKKRRAELT